MSSRRRGLMLRWSWRDLRRRWGLVLLTAFIVSLGTGTYAGLGGTTAWRLESADASYAALRYHDLRVRLPERTTVPAGNLAQAAVGIADAAAVQAVSERLIVPLQVDASRDGRQILVEGELVGAAPDADVDLVHVTAGRGPAAGAGEVLLDAKFAVARSLPTEGNLTVGGGRSVRYTGTGLGPSYFRVIGSAQQLSGEMGFAVLFAPLDTAQALVDAAGRVNDLVLRLAPGAPAAEVAGQLRAALADVGATVETRDDDEVRRALYADARNDETMWLFLSFLILAGASFAAFNLITRMVESERHEIGVGMALGATPRRLAVRPLLVGLQIALLGVLLGIGVGVYAGWAMRSVLVQALPLPVWLTPFQTGRFAQAALAGVLLPMLATVVPVRRALRVDPVEALRSIAPAAVRRATRPGRRHRRDHRRQRVVALMPVRNVVRAPRRTILTALGVAAAITTLVAVMGMIDSIATTLERSDAELGRQSPGRLEVGLTDFTTAESPQVQAVAGAPSVGRAEAGLRLGGTLRHGGAEVETLIDVIDLSGAMWVPSVVSGELPVGRTGLVISEKAAADLGVAAGDTVVLNHPVRAGLSYRLVDTELPVAAVHPDPLRFFTYVDASQVDLFGLAGIVDRVTVVPANGSSADDVRRDLFGQTGVGSVQEVGVLAATLEQRMAQLNGILRVLEGFALLLALLIAVNSATLAIEERRREQATMFAFGLPVGTVMRTIMVEIALVATLGTLLGLGTGYLALRWLLHTFTTETLPELGVRTVISWPTLLLVLALGIGVTSLAPLFALRRLRRTDIPSTLRVLE